MASRHPQWLIGSVAGATWPSVRLVAVALLVIVPLAFGLGRQLNAFQPGDDVATALACGSPACRSRSPAC